jgi:hypothetical protein
MATCLINSAKGQGYFPYLYLDMGTQGAKWFLTKLLEATSFRRFVWFFLLWRYSPNLGLGLPPWNSPSHLGLLDLRHSIGLLGRVISSSQSLYLHTNKRAHTNTKHLCPVWDSNPRSQLPSERRQCMPKTARPPWPADLYDTLCSL